MNYPLISEYIEAIKSAGENFDRLKYLRPVLDVDGEPVFSGGNFAVVFKMKDEQTGKLHAVKCFLKEQEGRAEAYQLIAEELEFVSCTFLTPIKYLDKELFVDTKASEETEFPVLLMDWIEGQTLDKYIQEHIDDEYGLQLLAYQFSRLAMWLMPQSFAHGDLKPDNILVRKDGTLVLVDYDGMYVPAMKGQKARELGSPDFRHPSRTEDDFDEHIDDFSLVSILLSLKIIALQPSFFKQFGAYERLMFSEKDYLNLNQCRFLKEIFPSTDPEFNILFTLFILAKEKDNLKDVSFRLLNLSKPKMIENEIGTEVKNEDWDNSWMDSQGVVYSRDKSRLMGVYGSYLPEYEIIEGTKIICDDSLNGFWNEIEDLMINGTITLPSSIRHIGKSPFRGDYERIICKSPFFEVIDDVLYSISETDKKLIQCFNRSYESKLDNKNITIPEGVRIIGERSFYDCEIGTITIPKSVHVIEKNPFISINFLSRNSFQIVCKSDYFVIHDNALYDIYNRTLISYFGKDKNVTILNGTKIIDDYAFAFSDLDNIVLPLSVEKIEEKAFYFFGGDSLSIVIPSGSAQKFGNIMPQYKTKLLEQESIKTKDIEDDINNAWIDEYGVKYSRNHKCLLETPEDLKNYIIKPGTVAICDYAFTHYYVDEYEEHVCFYSGLETISIPDSVKEIGKCSFYYCSELSTIALPDCITEISRSTFEGCEKLQSVYLPKLLSTIGERAFKDCSFLTSIHIPKCVTEIYGGAFEDCKRLESVYIHNNLKTIGEYAFSGCNCLKSFSIPDRVTSIGDYAFQSTKIASFKIPASLSRISSFAFCNVHGLSSIDVDINNIMYDSRDNCNAIIETATNTLITGCSTTIIPSSVTKIGEKAFFNCEFSSMVFPDSVEYIGVEAFYYCINLNELYLPDSLVAIDNEAFAGCSALQVVYMPKTVKMIGRDIFSYCNSLKCIFVPEGSKSHFEKLMPMYQNFIVEQDNKYLVKMANDFVSFIQKVDWASHNDLQFIVDLLPLVKIKNQFILDAFERGDSYGFSYQLYVHRLDANEAYSPSIPFKESMLITNRLTSEDSKEIPSIMSYFTVPFTEEGILQAWLLNNISNYMPRGWHAYYGLINYVFNMEDIVHSIPRDMNVEEKNKILSMSPDSFPPQVVIKDNEAVLIYLYWSNWRGLIQSTVKLRKVGNSIEFDEEKKTILAEYDCGIRF